MVEQAGAAFAFPSQTLYLGRDQVPDDGRAHAAEAAVRAWRDEGSLPFPNFSADQDAEAARIRRFSAARFADGTQRSARVMRYRAYNEASAA